MAGIKEITEKLLKRAEIDASLRCALVSISKNALTAILLNIYNTTIIALPLDLA